MRRYGRRAFACCFVLACSASALAGVEYFGSEQGRVTVEAIAEGLEHPRAVEFLPDGAGMLVTERLGRLRIVDGDSAIERRCRCHSKWVPSLGGPVITAVGVAFLSSTLDYYVRACDVTTGKQLWRSRLPAGGQPR